MMGVGALLLALGGGEVEGRHRPYYRCATGGRWRQRARARSSTRRGCTTTSTTLRQAGAARGLPRPRRLQAEGDRRGAAPDQAGPARRRPGRRARAPGASTCGASSRRRRRRRRRRGRAAQRHDHRARPARVRADRGRRLHPGRLPRARRCWPQLEARLDGRRGRRGALRHGAQPVGHRSRPTRRAWPHLVELAVEFARAPPRCPRARWCARCSTAAATASSSSCSRTSFRIVKPIKPKASRDKSAETFLVGIGLKPTCIRVR